MEVQDRSAVITLRNVKKTFGKTTVLDLDSMEIRTGRTLALVGHNGSGKSTLIKILSGVYAPDSAECVLSSGEITSFPLRQRADLRIIGIHQDLGLWDELTVAENIVAKWRPFETDSESGQVVTRAGRIRWGAVQEVAREVVHELGFDIDVRQKVQGLSSSDRATIAVARGYMESWESRLDRVSKDAVPGVGDVRTVICFDETSSYLHRDERIAFQHLISKLAESGFAVVIVSHDLDEIGAVADDFYVLRDGRCAGRFHGRQTQRRELVQAMFGAEYTSENPELRSSADSSDHETSPEVNAADPLPGNRNSVERQIHWVLDCQELSAEGLGPLDFQVGEGEVLGVTGLAGSGYDRLAYCLAGASHLHGGQVRVGKHVLPARFDPTVAVDHGIVLIPGDRQTEGGFFELSLRDNMIAPQTIRRQSSARFGWHISAGSFRRRVRELIAEFDILPSDPEARFWRLSGGNQQKAIVARWLSMDPKVIVMVEPTLGVDVAARARVHASIREFAKDDRSVVIASADLDELATVADRVIILKGGVAAFELAGSEISKKQLEELVVS